MNTNTAKRLNTATEKKNTAFNIAVDNQTETTIAGHSSDPQTKDNELLPLKKIRKDNFGFMGLVSW